MPEFSLKTILSTFSNQQGKKRTILTASPIGGVSSTTIKSLLIALPFIEYAILFNPYVFNILGLATSIVVYIVFLSVVMVIIFLIIFKVKNSVIKKITPSWEYYFKDIKIKMILSSGITPYSKFFQYYEKILKNNPSEEELYSKLLTAFKDMQEENSDLISAMNRDNKKI